MDQINNLVILEKVQAQSKKNLFEILAGHMAQSFDLCQRDISRKLCQREYISSTAMQGGIAVPHCEIGGLTAPLYLFARLDQPIDFESDFDDVDLLFVILMPKEKEASHTRLLLQMAQILKNKELCALLRASEDKSEMFELFHHHFMAQAA